MADAHIPKFGDREKDGFTKYFNEARKGRNEGKSVNPNDACENPDTFSNHNLPVHSPAHEAGSNTEAAKPIDERPVSREEGNGLPDSPRSHDPAARKPTLNSPQQKYGNRTSSDGPQRTPSKASSVSDRREDHSPCKPLVRSSPCKPQVRSSGRVAVSSSRERRGSLEGGQGLSPSTPGRSRFKTAGRGNEIPEKVSEVPKFGEWDEDPNSGDGYTGVFNIVAEERQGKVPTGSNNSTNSSGYKQDNNGFMSCGCFSWFKK